MELKDTIELMSSEDYKERSKAEYYQTKIRCNKLFSMLVKYENGMLNFIPNCDTIILRKQFKAMRTYLECLEERAVIEEIELDK
ncbi:MAG: hypothetical protein RR489_05135 [Clostridia bacterium]